jgi:hypothetical protein
MNELDVIDRIYLFFKTRDQTLSRRKFSVDWLEMSSNYYGYLRCSGKPPSDLVLLRISLRLRDYWKTVEGSMNERDRAQLLELARLAFEAGRHDAKKQTLPK